MWILLAVLGRYFPGFILATASGLRLTAAACSDHMIIRIVWSPIKLPEETLN